MARALAIALLLVGAAPLFPPTASVPSSAPLGALPPDASSGGAWIEAVPAAEEERELQDAARLAGSMPIDEGVSALLAVADAGKSSAAAGLARFAAGSLLLEAGRDAEALALLQHESIDDQTQLEHRAHLARARAFEKLGRFGEAADAYREGGRLASGPLRCAALLREAEIDTLLERLDAAKDAIQSALGSCAGREPEALLQLATVLDKQGDRRGAAVAVDRLDRDFPATTQAETAGARRVALASFLPQGTAPARTTRDLTRAVNLEGAGKHKAAVAALRAVLVRKPPADEADLARVRLGRALLAIGKEREAEAVLKTVTPGAAVEAEAAYHLAQRQARRAGGAAAYESVAARFPTSPWAEEALLSLAHAQQKDARDEAALPYYRRLVLQHPDGKYADAAIWRVAWWEYRQRDFAAAAARLEAAAKDRERSSYTPGFLYWAGRARRELGDEERARQHFAEVVRRFKHGYHGTKATAELSLPPTDARAAAPPPGPPIEEPGRTRVRNLILIRRYAEALDELAGLPPSPQVQATRSWVFSRQGSLRPAITAMKRAYPEWVSEGGENLPAAIWRILYPIQFQEALTRESKAAGLDPALVAALVWQESTFDPSAVSAVGARGLMQLMPPTGKELARKMGYTWQLDMLHDPERGLEMGTRYLQRMVDGFGGRVDKALAAYNAGPYRVSSWATRHPGQSAEEFIEGIPFHETRSYVMTILANREQYHRLYGLGADR